MSIKGYILTALKAEKLLIFFTLLYFTLVIRTIVSTNLTKINYFYERIKAKSSLMEIVFFVFLMELLMIQTIARTGPVKHGSGTFMVHVHWSLPVVSLLIMN